MATRMTEQLKLLKAYIRNFPLGATLQFQQDYLEEMLAIATDHKETVDTLIEMREDYKLQKQERIA